jgi:hypothetical protein
MVTTIAYEIFKEFKRRGIEQSFQERDPGEYRSILDGILSELNISKSTLGELESHNPGTSSELLYLMQSEMGIDFEICKHYKMWINRKGEQRRCWFNRGPVQVNCYGIIEKCEHDEERIESDMCDI